MKKLHHLSTIVLGSVMAALAGCTDHSTMLGPEAVLLGVGNENQPAPSNLAAVASAAPAITVTWTDNSTNEAGFEIHSSSASDGTFSLLTESGPNVTSLTFGMGYSTTACYRTRAYVTVGRRKRSYSEFSNTACATTPPSPPQAPSNTWATSPGSTVAQVGWTDNSTDEDGFRIERSPSPACTAAWEPAGMVDANIVTFTDGGRMPEEAVCYRVIAFKTAGSVSSPSPTAMVVPLAAPSGLTGQAPDHRSVELTWVDRSVYAWNYQVQRASAATGPFDVIANVYGDATAHTDAPLTGSTTYWYRVRAISGTSISDYSDVVSATTREPPPPSKPAAPTGISAWPNGSTAANVYWGDASWNETGFRIRHSLDGVNWVVAVETPADYTGAWTDRGVAEQRNCYQVVAFNDLGESPPSENACVMLIAGPTDALVRSDGLFTWNDQSNFEEGYELWYCGWEECAPLYALPPDTESYLDPWYYSEYAYYIVAYRDGGYSDFAGVGLAEGSATAGSRKTADIRTYLERSMRSRRPKPPR